MFNTPLIHLNTLCSLIILISFCRNK